MGKKPYTAALLKQFDKLTNDLSSHDQLNRINARLKIKAFVEKHGKNVCDAMFEELTKRDNKK